MEAIEPPVYDTLAIDAAGDYRAIDALVGEMARASEESLQPALLIRRFYALHRRFYTKIIILTSEDT
jgi:hypothetical protein